MTGRGAAIARADVHRLGREARFDLVKITRAEILHQERDRYLRWVEQGRHGEMKWINERHVKRSSDTAASLPEARSVVCCGVAYGGLPEVRRPTSAGLVARYAWGPDYHRVIGDMLQAFARSLEMHFGGTSRCHVDTGPVMDKAHAARSGLGWYGKNTNILTERFGSYVLLGEIVTSLELEVDQPLDRDCGKCSVCQVACPTGALGPDYTIDSRLCISYLTIEHRGPIPMKLRALVGRWVFGCDICQDVCPPTIQPHLQARGDKQNWVRFVRDALSDRDPYSGTTQADHLTDGLRTNFVEQPRPGTGVGSNLDLIWLLHLSHAQYLDAFRDTSLRRAKVWMLRRNAAVALGNIGTSDALPALFEAASNDDNAIVRGHAAWAIGQISSRFGIAGAAEALLNLLHGEGDVSVRDEIGLAISLARSAASPAASG